MSSISFDIQCGDGLLELASAIKQLSQMIPEELHGERDLVLDDIGAIFEACVGVEHGIR